MSNTTAYTPNFHDRDAEKLLFDNAIDFLNAGVSMMFSTTTTIREMKVAVVAIQTSVELFVKYRLIRDGGLSEILKRGSQAPQSITLDNAGTLRTIWYSDALKKIREDEWLSEADRDILDKAQEIRNSLVHFAAKVDFDGIKREAACLIIRCLGIFAAGKERDQGEFQDFRRFLDEKNFSSLTEFHPYRDEALDVAHDSLDSDKVFHCWNCKNHTLSYRPSTTYFCHCCGLTVDGFAASFADCCVCGKQDAVLYDPLNSDNNFYHGKCILCNSGLDIGVCKGCDRIYSMEKGKNSPSCSCCLEA